MSQVFMTPKGKTAHIVRSGKKTLCGLQTKPGKIYPISVLFDQSIPECDDCFSKLS
jgi:hypothetical protein